MLLCVLPEPGSCIVISQIAFYEYFTIPRTLLLWTPESPFDSKLSFLSDVEYRDCSWRINYARLWIIKSLSPPLNMLRETKNEHCQKGKVEFVNWVTQFLRFIDQKQSYFSTLKSYLNSPFNKLIIKTIRHSNLFLFRNSLLKACFANWVRWLLRWFFSFYKFVC